MDFLTNIEPWYWLVLACALLGCEALGAGGFLLGSAAASIVMAGVLWLFPALNWMTQITVFALLAFGMTIAYWRFFKPFNERSDHPQLNNRAASLIGQSVVVREVLSQGKGRVQIGDTLWKIQSSLPLEQGMTVTVKGYKGMILLVEADLS
ncbi:Inner membrane protein YbbJ [invertebrate metagenome]|uniref:Inner membrane protein YbbJ n=1 Tax=invertebrate metagenome TaxID=1711999 RepID=A0A2H9TCM4_9ZZZZ